MKELNVNEVEAIAGGKGSVSGSVSSSNGNTTVEIVFTYEW
ncbi:hypothetical protein [Pseudoalteromonas sp. NCIMB_1079]